MLYSYSSFIFKLLNISTFVENNINTMKKLDWFILVILLISPTLINYIVLGVSTVSLKNYLKRRTDAITFAPQSEA